MLRNSLDPEPDPYSDFWLDPDPYSMNMDPKHWGGGGEQHKHLTDCHRIPAKIISPRLTFNSEWQERWQKNKTPGLLVSLETMYSHGDPMDLVDLDLKAETYLG